MLFSVSGAHLNPHSLPTRRSSDLEHASAVEPLELARQRAGRDDDAAEASVTHEQIRAETEPHHGHGARSEEHTSELQSLTNLVCRLLLEKKKKHFTPCSLP